MIHFFIIYIYLLLEHFLLFGHDTLSIYLLLFLFFLLIIQLVNEYSSEYILFYGIL
jgi:hypothetical protein